MNSDFVLEQLTQETWQDFITLFGVRGACAGCWCMWWRLTRKQFSAQSGDGNRDAMKSIVESGQVPGLIAKRGSVPVGWVSVAPRDHFPSLNRSRTLKPVDSLPVWSIVCFFIAKSYRRKGLTRKLIQGAVQYAKANGAVAVEAYPVIARSSKAPDIYLYTGLVQTFLACGFTEICRRSPVRPIMRYFINRNDTVDF